MFVEELQRLETARPAPVISAVESVALVLHVQFPAIHAKSQMLRVAANNERVTGSNLQR